MTLNCMTLNDPEMPFSFKISFCVGLTKFICLAFSENYLKTFSRYSHTVSDEMFVVGSSFQ